MSKHVVKAPLIRVRVLEQRMLVLMCKAPLMQEELHARAQALSTQVPSARENGALCASDLRSRAKQRACACCSHQWSHVCGDPLIHPLPHAGRATKVEKLGTAEVDCPHWHLLT